jgi:hypothetical protein
MLDLFLNICSDLLVLQGQKGFQFLLQTRSFHYKKAEGYIIFSFNK